MARSTGFRAGLATGALLAALPLLAAGCGTTPGAQRARSGRAFAIPRGIGHLRRRAPQWLLPHGPPVGTTQHTRSEGSALAVTVQRLIDPLSGSGAALLPGFRAVAILVELANAGPALYDSSATGDFSVLASRGPVIPVFVPSGICQTPVEDFDRYMAAGAVVQGCVAFSVPARARIIAIRFSPHARAAGRLLWSPPTARRGP